MAYQQDFKDQPLTWDEAAVQGSGTDYLLHSSVVTSSDNLTIEVILANCVEHAVALLAENINDDSLYFMFEWDNTASTLAIVVTDDSKSRDAKHRVLCDLSAMNAKMKQLAESDQWKYQGESFADIVKHALHDYLTTCTGFMRYSLVAVFHQGSRQQTELL
ncbi:hypothetical protein [Zhongshania sp.]|uniref:hypothetical protein n=1 Tax=Zhongshania sp. TaxID=1971902 RepID=UPI002A81EFD1|nr:hypothetical protein [Zhongshania sp.]